MPAPTPTGAILWLADYGERDSYAIEEHARPHIPWLQFTCPSPGLRTTSKGTPVPAWFDMPPTPIRGLAMRTPDGLADAIKHVHDRLDELLVVTNFAPSRIAIGGFGMGGALAIAAGLSYRRPLAAILSHSGWMCQPAFELSAFGSMPHAAPNLETPIMLLAGDEDETVERCAVEVAGAALRAAGCQQVIFRSFEDTAHKFSLKSMGVMIDFLRVRVPERPPAPKAGGENAGVGAKSRTVIKMNGRRGNAKPDEPEEPSSPAPAPPSEPIPHAPPAAPSAPAAPPLPTTTPKVPVLPDEPRPGKVVSAKRPVAGPSPAPPPLSRDPATAAALHSGDQDALRRALERRDDASPLDESEMLAIAQMMLGNELGAAVASGQLQAAAEKAGLGPLPSGLRANAMPDTAPDEPDSDDDDAESSGAPPMPKPKPPPPKPAAKPTPTPTPTPAPPTPPPAPPAVLGDRNQHAQAAKYELNLESADEISLVVHVPAGVTSMEQLELAISAEHVQVHVGQQPFLDLALPTPIDEDSARAKFAKKAGKLHISARRAVVGIEV